MKFRCNFCDIEVIQKDLNKHRECGQVVHKHINNNPKNSDLNRILYDHVINHNKKFELYTICFTLTNEFKTVELCLTNTPDIDFVSCTNHLNFSQISY